RRLDNRPEVQPAPGPGWLRLSQDFAALAAPWAGCPTGSARDGRLHGRSRRLVRIGRTCCPHHRRGSVARDPERMKYQINLEVVRTVEWPHCGLREPARRACGT